MELHAIGGLGQVIRIHLHPPIFNFCAFLSLCYVEELGSAFNYKSVLAFGLNLRIKEYSSWAAI